MHTRYSKPLDYTRSAAGLSEALNRAEDRACDEGLEAVYVLHRQGDGYLLATLEEMDDHPGIPILAGVEDGERKRWASW